VRTANICTAPMFLTVHDALQIYDCDHKGTGSFAVMLTTWSESAVFILNTVLYTNNRFAFIVTQHQF